MIRERTYRQNLHSTISWGAIIGGVAIAAGVQILFSLLGLSIGLSTINPTTEAGAGTEGLGIGSMIWWLITGLISLFIGAWAASRLSGQEDRQEGLFHGLIFWSTATLLNLFLAVSVVGAMIGGGFWLMSNSIQALGQGAAAMVQTTGQQQTQQAGQAGQQQDLGGLRQELNQALQQTQQPALQPENLEQQAQQLQQELGQEAQQALQQPGNIDQQINDVIAILQQQAQQLGQAFDQEAIVNVVTARTNLTQQEAQQAVSGWYNQIEQAGQNVQQFFAQTGQEVAQTSEEVIQDLGYASLWTFFMLLLGVVVSGIGGVMGIPRYSQKFSKTEYEAEPARREEVRIK